MDCTYSCGTGALPQPRAKGEGSDGQDRGGAEAVEATEWATGGISGVSLRGAPGEVPPNRNQGNYWPRIYTVLCKTVKTPFILGAQK